MPVSPEGSRPDEPGPGIELLVGIPSYCEGDSIGFVVQQVDLGLARYFPDRPALIVNVDNHSPDDTRAAFLGTETRTRRHYVSTPEGVRGKGNNLWNLFELARAHAGTLRAGVVVDADLRSISPEWVQRLVEPILEGYDYVLPFYSRHQFDGSITNHICYPLIFALLERDLRQPIGGEFAFSPALLEHLLAQEWSETTRQYGIDVFMSAQAIAGGFRVCEAGLGAKVHKPSAPKLGPMFLEVVTTLFDLLAATKEGWSATGGAAPRPPRRFGPGVMDPPQEVTIDIRRMKEQLREEYESRRALLGEMLDAYTLARLHTMFEQDYYDLGILMWTQIVYRLLHRYERGSPAVRADVVEALRPLYFARTISFDYVTWRYSIRYAEGAVREQAMAFAAQKPFLLGLDRADG